MKRPSLNHLVSDNNVCIIKRARGGLNMDKYVCTICGFIYDEKEGYPEAGIKPGTRWEDIPEDFICPICGAGKSDFVRQ